MRLASKIFLTSAIVIVVLAGVAALSLRAINRLVSANRDIVTRTVPALRLTAAAREAIDGGAAAQSVIARGPRGILRCFGAPA